MANLFFDVPRSPDERRDATTSVDGEEEYSGVITTKQSAITFAGAPSVVTIAWKVIAAVQPGLATNKVIPVLMALGVGVLIYIASSKPPGGKERVTGFLFALLNSFVIAAAVLGIATATES
jgi:hypothetical protein